MQRGEETQQSKVTDVFSDDKKYFALVKINPLTIKLIETGKRFGSIYPTLAEELKVEKDEIKDAFDRIDKVHAPWKQKWGAGSPAEEVVDTAVKECAIILANGSDKHAKRLEMLDTLSLFMNTAELVLDDVYAEVSKQDKRIEYLEERCKLLSVLKEIKSIDREKYV